MMRGDYCPICRSKIEKGESKVIENKQNQSNNNSNNDNDNDNNTFMVSYYRNTFQENNDSIIII
jgi:hypothetical protein